MCAHRFVQFRRWPVKDRWRCSLCGMVTRRYDSIDYRMARPVHPHMSVVVPGYNTGDAGAPSMSSDEVGP